MSEPVLTESELAEIRDHALEDYPREACGFVLRQSPASTVMRCRNIMDELHQRSPTTYPRTAAEAFAIAPRDMLHVLRQRARGWAVHAVYHSHPRGGAAFSDEDLKWALLGDAPQFPDAAQVVVALPGRLLTAAHGYRWDAERHAFRLAGVLSWERRLDPVRGAVLVTRQPRVLPLVALTPVAAPS